jgi:hypothetical protein
MRSNLNKGRLAFPVGPGIFFKSFAKLSSRGLVKSDFPGSEIGCFEPGNIFQDSVAKISWS